MELIGHNSAGRTRCIFRAHGDRGYTKLKNTFLQDRRISDETRGLVARLLSLPEDWEVTVASIIASGKAGRDKVYRMLKEAEEFGYMKPEQQGRAGGKFDRQVYLVSDDPQALIARVAEEIHLIETVANLPLPEKPDTVETAENNDISPCEAKPYTGEPYTAEPYTGEPYTANRTHKKNIEDNINIPPIVPQTGDEVLELTPDEEVKPKKRAKQKIPDVYSYDFEEFWKVYPRGDGKGAAFQRWEKLSITQKRRAYVALKSQLPYLTSKLRDPSGKNLCPHASTWLNQGRFDDDVQKLGDNSAGGSAYSRNGSWNGSLY